MIFSEKWMHVEWKLTKIERGLEVDEGHLKFLWNEDEPRNSTEMRVFKKLTPIRKQRFKFLTLRGFEKRARRCSEAQARQTQTCRWCQSACWLQRERMSACIRGRVCVKERERGAKEELMLHQLIFFRVQLSCKQNTLRTCDWQKFFKILLL